MSNINELKPIISLNPFARFCCTIGNLPSSYMVSLTYEEQLLWFCDYLQNTIIPAVNNNAEVVKELQELYVKLKNYVDNYFDNLDVQEEINNKLDEMVIDGNLQNIINSILNKNNGTLVCNIEYRDCDQFINGITNEDNLIKGYAQGMTTTPSSFLIARKVGGSKTNDLDNMCFLQEISKSTGNILKEAYLELFHANSLAFNEDTQEIYVATTNYTDNEGIFHEKNDIIIIDYNTFQIKETITPPSEITNNNRVRSVSYDNKNKMLALADTTDIWIMKDFNTISNHIKLNYSFTAPDINPSSNTITNQNIVVFNNKIYYTRFYANGINIFDLKGNLLQNYYNFNTDIPLLLGELESIAIEQNGDLYLLSVQNFKL